LLRIAPRQLRKASPPINAPDLSQQCRPGPRLDLVLDPRFAGAERVESRATQLQAGELASLNYAGGSSRPAPQMVLAWAGKRLRHCFPKSNRCLSFFNPIGASLFGIRGYCRARSPRHISIMTVPVGRKCRSKSPLTKRRCPRRNRIPRLPSRDEDPNDHAAVEAMQARSEAVKAEDPSGLRVQYLLPSSG